MMPYVPIGLELVLGGFGLWVAYFYWTVFDGEKFWRILAGTMTAGSIGAFVAAGFMLANS